MTRRFTATGKVCRTTAGDLRYEGEARMVEDRSVSFVIEGPVHFERVRVEGTPSPVRTTPPRPAAITEEPVEQNRRPLVAEAADPPIATVNRRHRSSSPLSTRLDLLLPVSLVMQRLTEKRAEVSEEAAVFASAVVEYACAELIDDGRAASTASGGDGRGRITADDLRVGVLNDREMYRLLGGVTLHRD